MIIRSFRADKLQVMIADSRAQLGKEAGKLAETAIRETIERKGTANVMFAAAPSQDETLKTLCESREIDWSKVNALHMDEYIGLAETHPAGFRNYLKKAIFDQFTFRSVHLLNGNAADIDAEIARYSELLKQYPLDVVLLGIGENGHLAFNDPSFADFEDRAYVKVVELEQKCRLQQVHDGCFGTLSEVPSHALTVTIPPLMNGSILICSAPGSTKADAARRVIRDEISTACPGTIMRRHENAYLFLDSDSAEMII